jgi:hypothetical protein
MKTKCHWKQKLKKTSQDGKISHSHELVESTLWKMAVLPKAIHNHSPVKIPVTFFTEIEKNNSKTNMETWKPWIAEATLSKNSSPGDITTPDFKLYYTAIAIKKKTV